MFFVWFSVICRFEIVSEYINEILYLIILICSLVDEMCMWLTFGWIMKCCCHMFLCQFSLILKFPYLHYEISLFCVLNVLLSLSRQRCYCTIYSGLDTEEQNWKDFIIFSWRSITDLSALVSSVLFSVGAHRNSVLVPFLPDSFI